MVIFSDLEADEFDVAYTYHADAILSNKFSVAAQELHALLADFRIPIDELVTGGGGEAKGTQRLRKSLTREGWTKKIFRVEKRINDVTTFSQSHEVDHVKDFESGTVALEIEWNNKDPFYDRDLENFHRLHGNGAISLGIIVTRGASFQNGIKERLESFAVRNKITSFSDLANYGLEPTSRQKSAVATRVERKNISFAAAWADAFVKDKFGSATTHWDKLSSRLENGVGSPCPILAIGIPLVRIVDP